MDEKLRKLLTIDGFKGTLTRYNPMWRDGRMVEADIIVNDGGSGGQELSCYHAWTIIPDLAGVVGMEVRFSSRVIGESMRYVYLEQEIEVERIPCSGGVEGLYGDFRSRATGRLKNR